MGTKLERIAEISATTPKPEFTSLYHLINAEMLMQCHKELDGKKAVGIDRVTKAEYEEHLEENITNLVERLKNKAYKPLPSLRVYIPKSNGKMRPLGIASYEDKIVQLAAKKILEAIYEPRFLNCMYGFRPNRGCHDAIKEVHRQLQNEWINYVVDADIRGFFDHMSHEWLMKFLGLYIKDRNLLWLINKYLKAGVVTEGVYEGGVIVDSGNFDWTNGKFPDLTEPDESYHGISYTETYGKKAYIVKARMQLMRDFGVYPAAHSAFLLNLGLETLAVRMKQYCENAMTVAKYLEQSDKVEKVNYPGLESDENYELARKYLSGCSGVISFVIKGGKEAAVKFMNKLQLASNEVHVSDIRTCVLHPASETHRQLTDEQLAAAGIEQGLVRLSVGLENVEDIIADLEQAFLGL